MATTEAERVQDEKGIPADPGYDDGLSGRTIGDVTDDEPEDDGTGQFAIPGTLPKLSTSFGGRRPETSEAKIAAMSLPVDGQFEMGETFWVAVEVEVTDGGIVYHKKGRDTVGIVRRHKLTPLRIEKLDVPPTAE